MQEDFHYYATYCASVIAGYSHKEALQIAYSANFVDCCTKTMLQKLHLPTTAATTQSQIELADANTDIFGLQDITRIWASFHFLPGDLDAKVKSRSKTYRSKYRLICLPNSDLVKKTVNNAKENGLEAIGVAMHVLADTWAHQYFAGTPSLVINNSNDYFYEIVKENKKEIERKITFTHNITKKDAFKTSTYINSIYQENENGIMNLGHGRVGHLPDYSFIKYKYMPAWGNYEEIIKDNPDDYLKAFCQMVYALKYLKGDKEDFELNTYGFDEIKKYEKQINEIIRKPQLNASQDWKKFGEELSGEQIEDFDINKYQEEYKKANTTKRTETGLSKFVVAAIKQKKLVTENIYASKNLLAGKSIDSSYSSLKKLKEFFEIIQREIKEVNDEKN